MPDHPTGNPDLIHQHKVLQRQGDAELKGAEPAGKDAPGLEQDELPEERVAGVVKPDRGSPRLPAMKPSHPDDETGGGSGEGNESGGAAAGP